MRRSIRGPNTGLQAFRSVFSGPHSRRRSRQTASSPVVRHWYRPSTDSKWPTLPDAAAIQRASAPSDPDGRDDLEQRRVNSTPPTPMVETSGVVRGARSRSRICRARGDRRAGANRPDPVPSTRFPTAPTACSATSLQVCFTLLPVMGFKAFPASAGPAPKRWNDVTFPAMYEPFEVFDSSTAGPCHHGPNPLDVALDTQRSQPALVSMGPLTAARCSSLPREASTSTPRRGARRHPTSRAGCGCATQRRTEVRHRQPRGRESAPPRTTDGDDAAQHAIFRERSPTRRIR
jgi:hypothetical protein